MKLTNRLTKHMNVCTDQIIQQVFPIYMQSKQDTPMSEEDDDALKIFEPYKDEESILEEKNIERDYRDLVDKSLNTWSFAKNSLSGRTLQDELLASELSSSLREVRFYEQEFSVDKPVSDINYYHLDSQNNNLFYPFNDQLNYTLTNYFVESETTKSNVDKFLSNLLMAPLTRKLSYWNADK